MTYSYGNGLVPSNGPSWLAGKLLFLQSKPTWVDSATGVDDASHGGSKDFPVATLAYGVAQCFSDNPTGPNYIVLSETHNETITSEVEIAHRVHLIGLGRPSGGPRASLSFNGDGHIKLTTSGGTSASGTILENIRFYHNADTTCVRMLEANTTSLNVDGCLFEYGELCGQQSYAISDVNGYPYDYVEAPVVDVKNTVFRVLKGTREPGSVSVGTIYMHYNAQGGGLITLEGVTLDGNGVASLGIHVRANQYRTTIRNITLLGGSDMNIEMAADMVPECIVSVSGVSQDSVIRVSYI